MSREERSYCIEVDSSDGEGQWTPKPSTSKSQKESMFEFLKRRRKSKVTTPSRASSVLDPEEKNQNRGALPVLCEVTPNLQPSSRLNMLAHEKPSNYTFADSCSFPGQNDKHQFEPSLPAQSLHSEHSSVSPKSRSSSGWPNDALTKIFFELSEQCNSFAQAGVNYKCSTEQLITQALELTKCLKEPEQRRKHSQLKSCWTAVQSLFKQFQAMDASETVNNMRLAIREHMKAMEAERIGAEASKKREVGTQINDAELEMTRKYLESAQQKIIDIEKEQLKKKNEHEIQLLNQHEQFRVDLAQKVNEINTCAQEIESLKAYISELQQQLRLEQLINERLKAEGAQAKTLIEPTDRTELYRAPQPTRGSFVASQEASPSSLAAKQSEEFMRDVRLHPQSTHQRSDLICQLHSTADQLYDYWSTLRAIQQTLVHLRLYHKVSQHYQEISFNERLYV